MKKLRLTSLSSSAAPTEASSTEPGLVGMPRLGQLGPTSRPSLLSPSSLERLKPPKRAPLRVLDFDIENRPLSYLGADFTTADITAIAASFCGNGPTEIRCWLLGHHTPESMLQGFVTLYDDADMVTGHYIRKHDLPIINGALLEYGFPSLKPKLTSDTKLDLVKRSGISASQENLAAMLGVPSPKVGMNQHMWRQANRLEPNGIELVRQRVVGDVKQHKQLRKALVERGMLGPPRVWSP
jgi:hypothetical protein